MDCMHACWVTSVPVPRIPQARTLEWLAISFSNACMHAKSLQSCLTLCNPMDISQPGSSVLGILQARILEWVAISFSNACMHAKSLQSCLTLCDPMDSSPPGSPSLGFSRQEHWSGLPFPSPMHESEKWKWRCSVVSDSLQPPWTAAYQAPLSMGFSRQKEMIHSSV